MKEQTKEIFSLILPLICITGFMVAIYDTNEQLYINFDCPNDYKAEETQEINNVIYGKCIYNKIDYEIINNEFVEINNSYEPIIKQSIPPGEHGILYNVFRTIGIILFLAFILFMIYATLVVR